MAEVSGSIDKRTKAYRAGRRKKPDYVALTKCGPDFLQCMKCGGDLPPKKHKRRVPECCEDCIYKDL